MIKYYSIPSPLQKASFGNAVVNCVRSGDTKSLEKLLFQGLSPNPCNEFGDSLLNMICKRGDEKMFNSLLCCGATIEVIDSFGRTPLHHVCWCKESNFYIVEKILRADPSMIIAKDSHGLTPLEYVTEEKWSDWVDFLIQKGDTFWPTGSSFRQYKMDQMKNSVSISDPSGALSIEDAKRVSSGETI